MKPEFPRRAKDRLNSQLSGQPSALPTLAELVDRWRRQNPYSQFHLFGIWDPRNFSWAQEIISQGPDAWQENSVSLSKMANWHRVVVPQEATQIIEGILAGEGQESDGLIQTLERHHDNLADSLKQYIRDCGNFFSNVARHGLAWAAVVLAADEPWEKPHRRHERLAHVLEIFLPDLEVRLRLFKQVIDSPESNEQAGYCKRWRAVRYLPAMLEQDARLTSILRELLHDKDDLVRYWAADHLSMLDPATMELGDNLLIAFRERVSDGYDDCEQRDAAHAQRALARLGQFGVMQLARPLAEQQAWIELTRCCEVLAKWELPEIRDFLGEVREQLRPRIPTAWYDRETLARSTLDLLAQACSRIYERWSNDEVVMWSHDNVETLINKYRPRRRLKDWLSAAAKRRLRLTKVDQIQDIRCNLKLAWRITSHDLTSENDLPKCMNEIEVLVSQALTNIDELENQDLSSVINPDLLTAFEQISNLHRLLDATIRGDEAAGDQLSEMLKGL